MLTFQFDTNLRRTGVFPPLTVGQDTKLRCVRYKPSNNGYITGLCGCFMVISLSVIHIR